MVTKFRKQYASFLLSAGVLALSCLAGCGGGSKTNVVKVSVTPNGVSVIVSQSLTLAAVITGTTNTDVSGWTCEYTTTVVDTAGKSTTSNKNPCTADTGNIPSSGNTDTTVVFTAPSKVPDLTKLPGNNCSASQQACFLSIIITATSAADTKQSGSATLALDSGIVVTLTPGTATVPTNEQEQFNATLTNDLQSQGVSWLVTQGTPTTTAPYPSLPTCSPGCGSIDDTGKYTAPGTLPTTASLKVVATSKADATRFAVATVTVIQGGPITFNSISPTIAPQGATFYDIYLDAPFISSASTITLTKQSDHTTIPITSASGQVKVLFPIPTSSVTNPPSTGARLRLTVNNLAAADTYTVSVSDPAQTVTNGAGPFSFTVVPVRPSSVASIPDSVPQNGQSNDLRVAINGGYFGPNGQLASAVFNGNTLSQDSTVGSSSRQLNLIVPSSAVSSSLPGLYPLSVTRTTPPLPSPNNPSVTNLAVFPDYSSVPPSVAASFAAGSGPSAMDVDAKLGILAVAETGSNLVQFFGIGDSLLTPLPCPTTSCAVNAPTGLSINQSNHTVAVVSPEDQSVVVLPLPGSSGAPGVTYPLVISLAGLISPADVVPLPVPYSVGVDSDTNMAIVAYSSSATPTTAKVGFLLDLNKDSQTCLAGVAQTTPPCPHAQVTLNTGPYPQVAMVPHAHQAFVTPGGAGVIQGIDVTKASSQLAITNVSLTSGLVTVTVNVPSGQTLGLNPGNPGTVLIQGVPPGSTNNTDFNGVFTVQSVLNASSFTYAMTSSVNDSATGDADSTVYFSTPNITVAISPTTQGIAINPITRTAAIADANATGAVGSVGQIDLLNSLDQSVTSITLHAGCTIYTTSCSNAPELLGTSSVAFQPYSNALVSYNPQLNQVSLSNPVNLRRYAIVCASADACQNSNPSPGPGSVTFTPAGASAAVTLNLFGAVAVDPATNQAFVAQSGSGNIQVVKLGIGATALKSAEITELQVPTVSGALIGGIPGALMPQGTLTSSSPLANVQIVGAGFDAGTQVRLDGTAVPGGNVQFVSTRLLNVTIPASFLAQPHRYAVDVLNGSGVRSNVTDFLVIKAVDLTTACSGGNPQPSSVAIADQLPGQAFAPIAVVSNTGCDNVAVVDINPASATFGAVKSTIATGTDPVGVAVSPRFGLAVVANSTDGTVSVLDLKTNTQKVAAVTVGSSPTGVAISESSGAALIANHGSNTVSEINLALLFGSSPATSLTPLTIAVDVSPIAVAIDPDRGTNSLGLAVVSAVQLITGGTPIGVLDAIDIGGSAPAKSTSAQVGTVVSTPTGLVFDASVSPALFYASSSGGNVITSYNPDGTGGTASVHVGINPTSLAINPQTGALMTVNSASQTVSIVDTLANSFKTRRTFGLGGSPQFGIAIDQFLNMAVLADQANNRLLIFPMPN